MVKVFIDAVELADLLGVTERIATKVISDTNKRIEQAGGYVINTRPPKAPRAKVYELLGIEERKEK